MITYLQLPHINTREKVEIPFFTKTGLKAFITLKSAGDMSFQKRNLLSDKSEFLKKEKLNPEKFFSVTQEHSKQIIQVKENTHPDIYTGIKADGLISHKQALFLTVTVADCLPIYISDKKTGAFGIVHSGWKGTGIVLNAIDAMHNQFKCRIENIKIIIGPGIGACCYDVPYNRYREFLANYGNDCAVSDNGKYYLALNKANLYLLKTRGIEDITVIDHCTCCCNEFHSYRREGGEVFKRMLAYIGYY